MSDPKRRISVDHDSVTTNFTEQDEAPITPRTANSTAIQQDRQQTFDDLPSAPLPLLYSLGSPITPAFQKGDQVEQDTSIQHPKMTAPINVSPTAVGVVNGVRAPEYQQPHGFQAYPYAMPQAKEMHMSGAPMAGYRRDSRFDPMVKDGEVEDDGGYGELGQRHPLRRVQEEEREDGVSLPSIRNLFSVAGEKERALPVNGQPAAASTGNASPVSSSPTMQDARSRYSGSTFSSVSDAQFGWWNGTEYDRSRSESASGPFGNMPFRSNSFPNAGPMSEDHDAKRRRSDQPASMRDPEEAARLRWQAQNRNASYPASGSMAGNGLRSLIHPPHGSYPRSVSINDGTAYPPPPPTHDDSMRPPVIGRNGSVGTQLARSFADLSAAERSARNSVSRSPSMAPPPAPGSADRRQSTLANGPLTRSTPLYEGDRRQSGNPYDASRQAHTQPPSPDRHNGMRQAGISDLYNDTVSAPSTAGGNYPTDMSKPNTADSMPWSRRTSGAETAASSVHLNSDSEGSTAKGSRGKKRSIDGAGPSEESIDENGVSESGMGGMDVLAESAERAGAAAEDGIAERDPSPPRNGTGPKYTCSFCQKTFSRPSSLRIHTYSHTGERPFVCQEPSCGRRFSVQSNLKRHAKVHALVNQQEAERLRALYAHHPHDQRHANGLPPMHMQHAPMQGQMPGMQNSGPPPPPHIMDMRDPRMFAHGNPVMQHPGHNGPGASFAPGSQHAGGMPPHAQAPPMPYGYPGMPSMHMAPGPGMNPPAQSAAVPPQMPSDSPHGYGNYGFYDQQGPAGMSGYAPPPQQQQHQHTLPPPMNSLPPLQSPMSQGYHMQPGQDMADPYQYQKN